MQAKDFLANNKLVGNYVIVGDDAYLRDKVIAYAKSFLPAGIVEFNYNVLSLGRDNMRDVIDTLNLAPAFSDVRLVYVKEVRDKLLKEHVNMFKEYLASPAPTSVLIINDDKGNASTLRGELVAIDCNSYTNADSAKFVIEHAEELGGSISSQGAKLLSEYCQYDMMRIDAELRKLVEYKEGALISDVDIRECVHADVDYEIYEIANAVGEKNLNKALSVIDNLMQGGLKASDVLSQLSRAFRRMLYVKISPLSDAELATVLEVKPFAIKKTRERLGVFTPLKLKNIYDNINDMEFAFKSGVMSDTSALDDVLVKIFV